jgi:hypothetical protein
MFRMQRGIPVWSGMSSASSTRGSAMHPTRYDRLLYNACDAARKRLGERILGRFLSSAD